MYRLVSDSTCLLYKVLLSQTDPVCLFVVSMMEMMLMRRYYTEVKCGCRKLHMKAELCSRDEVLRGVNWMHAEDTYRIVMLLCWKAC
jgi:hypothetical protein